jgi:hypothetical protein
MSCLRALETSSFVTHLYRAPSSNQFFSFVHFDVPTFMMASIVLTMMVSSSLWLIVLSTLNIPVHGFVIPSTPVEHSLARRIARQPAELSLSRASKTSLSASSSSSRSREGGFGGGMGMGQTSSSSTNSKTKKQRISSSGTPKKPSSSASSSKSSTPFDVSASVLRHEKSYDQLLLQAAKRMAAEEDDDDDDSDSHYHILEFVVAARDGIVLPDWVPIGQLIVAVDPNSRNGRLLNVDDGAEARLAQAGVSAHCRELHHVAGLASNTFRTIPRQHVRYAIEPAESFYKHVYDKVVDVPPTAEMSTVEARKVLKIEEGGTLRDLKLQYRRRSMECHPDRIRHHPSTTAASSTAETTPNDAKTTVGESDAGDEFSRVKLAYETLLGSGSMRKEGSSWYESLGGRERSDFAVLELISLREAADAGFGVVEGSDTGIQSAIMGIDPSLVQSFVARSRASK